ALWWRTRSRHLAVVEWSTERLRRLSAAEIVTAATALVAAAALAAVATPPVVPATASGLDGLTVEGSDLAGSLRAELTVAPGYPGLNRFAVRVARSDAGELSGAI